MLSTFRKRKFTPRQVASAILGGGAKVWNAAQQMSRFMPKRRRTMVRSVPYRGSRSLKARRYRKRTTGRAFEKRVKKVVNKDKPTGIYAPTRVGMLKNIQDQQILLGGQKHNDLVDPGNATISGTVFNFFSAKKIEDASAILFNGKTGTINSFETTTGNFTDLKVDIKSMKASMKIHNGGNHDVEFIVHEFTAKQDDLLDPESFVDNKLSGPMVNNLPGGTYNFDHKHWKSSEIPGFNKYWTHTRKTIKIKCGQYKVLTFKGKTNYHYDYEAHLVGADFCDYIKGTTRLIWLEQVTPVLYTYEVTATSRPGYAIDKPTGLDVTVGVTVEIHEEFVLTCPELATEARQIYTIAKPNWGITNRMLTVDARTNTGLDTDILVPI